MTPLTTLDTPPLQNEEEEKDAIDLYLERMGKVRTQPTLLIPFDDYFDGRIPDPKEDATELASFFTPSPPPVTRPSSPETTGWKEIVLDSKGRPRQAGSDGPEGRFVSKFRALAERDLYAFSYGILGYNFLSPGIHRDSCLWLQRVPPFRKLLMLPRLHAKSAIVSQCFPLHVLIQDSTTNLYMPGIAGSDCRILMACETENLGKKWLRVVKNSLSRNILLRAFWPHICWENAKQQSPKWSEGEIIVPRENEWPDPTIRAIGVGGAITGARPNILIEDDLISIEAANSESVMQTAIDWHIAARALLDEYEEESGLQSLEMILGTHWSAKDLYKHIEDNDPSVEIRKRAIYEPDDEGKLQILWPERWTWKRIEQLKLEFGSLFPLLYMNDPYDPEIVDFDLSKVRKFAISGEKLSFSTDSRDTYLQKKLEQRDATSDPPPAVGLPLNSDTYDLLFPQARNEYLMQKWKEMKR
jgi:hypothetical protein